MFCDTKLFDKTLRMQNRSTGAGVTPTRTRNLNERALEPNPTLLSRIGQIQPHYMQPQPNFHSGQINPYLNMPMNNMVPTAGLSNSLPSTPTQNNGFIPPFLPLPPGINPQAFNSFPGGNQDFNQMHFNMNSPDNQNQRNLEPRHREREDHRHNGYSNYRSEDRGRKRDDRSRSYDRSRSRGYENHDRRRR